MAIDEHEVNEIRRHMAQIRRELHEDIQAVVAGAEAASNWKYYVVRYPWAALGLASIAGYLVIPKRRVTATEAAEEAVEESAERFGKLIRRGRAAVKRKARVKEFAEAGPTPEFNSVSESKPKKAGLLGMAFGMVAPVALRVAQSYAANYLETWLMQQQAASLGPMSAGSSNPSAGPRPGSMPASGPRPGQAPGHGYGGGYGHRPGPGGMPPGAGRPPGGQGGRPF